MKRPMLAGVVLALLLAGCTERPGEPGGWGVQEVDLPDGRTVICVGWDNRANAGGIDCDWGTAR